MDRKRFDAQQRNVHRLQPVIETLDLWIFYLLLLLLLLRIASDNDL
jgi:hypothetical protein